MTRNMTEGTPAKLILLFMAPLLIGNIFQQVYGMADTFIVGRTIGVSALASVGSTSSFSFLILGFAMGSANGMAIIAAQRFGAGDFSGLKKSFTTSLIIGAGISLVLTVVSTLFVRRFLVLLRTPADIIDNAFNYIFIILCGIPVVMLFNLLSCIMRAVGNSRSPLYFLISACVLNIILDYTFILVFKMGTAGAAFATVIAQTFSCVLCIIYIRKKIPVLRFEKSDWHVSADELKEHLRMGIPVGFQMSIIAIGAIALQFALNNLGTDSVAAYTTANRIDNIAMMPMNSFGITMATYSAQNYGAGKIDRIFKGLFQCCIMSLFYTAFICVVNLLFGRTFAAFFLGNEPAVIEKVYTFLMISSICYIFLAILFIFRNTIQGVGIGSIPTAAGIVELVMRTVAALVFTRFWGFTGACFASPLAWIGSCVLLTVSFIFVAKRLRIEQMQQAALVNES